jgi:hypothetical protein
MKSNAKEGIGLSEEPAKQRTTIEDSITVGILGAVKSCEVTITPRNDSERNKVVFDCVGDIEGALKAIYNNQLVGALDVLRSIKSARSAIYNFRGKK